MGVDFSKEAARPPLSIACVAEISQIDAAQFETLRETIRKLRAPIQRRKSSHNLLELEEDDHAPVDPHAAWRAYDLTIANVEDALECCDIASHDRIVLERIFTIMDRTGDEVVHALELLVAMALMVQVPFTSKLEFAVKCLLDDLHDKPLAPMHLLFLVSTMTTVANYFGDPLLPLPVLEGIADDAFQELSCAADFDAHKPVSDAARVALVQALDKHPYVQEYISQERSAWSPR